MLSVKDPRGYGCQHTSLATVVLIWCQRWYHDTRRLYHDFVCLCSLRHKTVGTQDCMTVGHTTVGPIGQYGHRIYKTVGP